MYVKQGVLTQTGFNDITTISQNPSSDQPTSFSSRVNKKKLFLATYFVAGTFGISVLSAGTITAYAPVRHARLIASTTKSIVSDSGIVAQDIGRLREITKISISEIASTLKVSRQTVHEWMKGGSISARNTERLSQFVQVADVFDKSEVAITPYAMRRRVNGGPSVLQTIALGGNAVEVAQTLVKTVAIELRQQQRSTQRLSNRGFGLEVKNDSNSTPSDITV